MALSHPSEQFPPPPPPDFLPPPTPALGCGSLESPPCLAGGHPTPPGEAGQEKWDIPPSPHSCPRSSAARARARPGAEGLGTSCSRLPTTSNSKPARRVRRATSGPRNCFLWARALATTQALRQATWGSYRESRCEGKPGSYRPWGPGTSGGQGAVTPAGIALSRALTWGPLLTLESESPNGQKCSSQNAQNRKRKKHSSGPIRRWLPKGVGWQDPAQAQARWQVGGALHCQAGTAGGGGDLTPSLTAAQQEGKLRPRPSREASAGGGAALPPPSSSGQPQLPHNVEAQPWSQRAPTRDVGPPSHCRTLVLGATLCPEDPQAAARGGDWATQALWARVGPPGIWTETPPPLALFHPCALAAGVQMAGLQNREPNEPQTFVNSPLGAAPV